jgi:hypothetical protein
MLNEPKQTNSGTPQGVFLKRQMVLKADGSGLPILPEDLRVGLDIAIAGRCIRVYDCDEYSRDYCRVSTLNDLNVRRTSDRSSPLPSSAETALSRAPRNPLL